MILDSAHKKDLFDAILSDIWDYGGNAHLTAKLNTAPGVWAVMKNGNLFDLQGFSNNGVIILSMSTAAIGQFDSYHHVLHGDVITAEMRFSGTLVTVHVPIKSIVTVFEKGSKDTGFAFQHHSRAGKFELEFLALPDKLKKTKELLYKVGAPTDGNSDTPILKVPIADLGVFLPVFHKAMVELGQYYLMEFKSKTTGVIEVMNVDSEVVFVVNEKTSHLSAQIDLGGNDWNELFELDNSPFTGTGAVLGGEVSELTKIYTPPNAGGNCGVFMYDEQLIVVDPVIVSKLLTPVASVIPDESTEIDLEPEPLVDAEVKQFPTIQRTESTEPVPEKVGNIVSFADFKNRSK